MLQVRKQKTDIGLGGDCWTDPPWPCQVLGTRWEMEASEHHSRLGSYDISGAIPRLKFNICLSSSLHSMSMPCSMGRSDSLLFATQ